MNELYCSLENVAMKWSRKQMGLVQQRINNDKIYNNDIHFAHINETVVHAPLTFDEVMKLTWKDANLEEFMATGPMCF